jgi:hypothetical protein
MSQNSEAFNLFDPTGLLKNFRDVNQEAWSKMMIQLVHSEAYAQATGALLDTWLANSAPFRKALEEAMAKVLANFNMPTRQEVISLAERLTNLEFRLDDLDARLDEIQAAAPRPTEKKEKKS